MLDPIQLPVSDGSDHHKFLDNIKSISRNRNRFALIAAAAASVTVESGAEAADFYNSGPITSNNTVGWINGSLQQSTFSLNLKSGTARVVTNSLGDSNDGTFSVLFGSYEPGQNLAIATQNTFLEIPQIFNLSATIGGAITLHNGQVVFGKLSAIYYGSVPSTLRTGIGVSAVSDKYLLFKFQDNAEDYNGWVEVTGATGWNGSNKNVFLTVKSYAWQKASFGVIKAGATAVPEPSTLVTSGIAALAGGATALRRWRRERKAKPEAA